MIYGPFSTVRLDDVPIEEWDNIDLWDLEGWLGLNISNTTLPFHIWATNRVRYLKLYQLIDPNNLEGMQP